MNASRKIYPHGRQVEIGLTQDEDGRFFIEGEPVTHERTHQALLRGLFVDPATNRVCTRIGPEWSTVEVADTPLLVVAVGLEEEPPWLGLSDGSAEKLEPETLWMEEGRLYCRVRQGSLEARWIPTAAADLLVRFLRGPEESPSLEIGGEPVDLHSSKRGQP